MIAARRVEREFLDDLPANDPRAIHSRRDLRLCNALMFQPAIMAGLLARHSGNAPRTMVDIGSGDGRCALAIARRLVPHWPGVRITLVDQKDIVSDATLAGFSRLGWQAERASADVFDFFDSSRRFDVITANLFLHHFPSARLTQLLALIARSTQTFVAGEPRRGPAAAIGCRFLPLFGCNDITLHDSVVSVRAGFRGKELSALWQGRDGWNIFERGAIPFTHCFAVTRRNEAGP